MDTCIFCKIIAGDIPSHKVYEDEHVFAFLDIHPINSGHTLVVPKKHAPVFHEMDDESYDAVMCAAKKIAQKIHATIAPLRVGLMVVGLDVSHTHVHVVPIHESGDITSKNILENTCGNPSPEELAKTQQKLVL